MSWYYVDAGQQAGPVTDEQLDELVRSGKVRNDTLIWREGMANWQAYAQARPGAATPAIAAPPIAGTPATAAVATGNDIVCAECHQIFPKDNAIQYGDAWVCAGCKPRFVQRLREGATLPGTGASMRYAGFWIRVVAKIVDIMIVSAISWPISALLRRGLLAAPNTADPFALMRSVVLLQALLSPIGYLYNSLFLMKLGATPGKMALGLKVVSADGSAISAGKSFGRPLAEILSGMICYIGYIITAFDAQKRALHDHIAGTRVIRTR